MDVDRAREILGQAATGNLDINDGFKEACRFALQSVNECERRAKESNTKKEGKDGN